MDIPHLPRPRWRDVECELLPSVPVTPLHAACSCRSRQRMPSGCTSWICQMVQGIRRMCHLLSGQYLLKVYVWH